MAKKSFDVPTGMMYRPLPEEVTIIGVDHGTEDVVSPFHFRAHAPITEDMIKSVSEAGVVTPIRVWKDESGRMVCINGCRRVLALRAANAAKQMNGQPGDGLQAIECVSFDEALRVRNTGNEFGEEDPPSKRAELVAITLEQPEMTQKIVGELYGVHEKTIRTWVALAGMFQGVKDAVDDGSITLEAAMTILYVAEDGDRRKRALEEQEAELDNLLKVGGGGGGAEYFKPKAKHFKEIAKRDDLIGKLHKKVQEFVRWLADPKGVDPSTIPGLTEIIANLDQPPPKDQPDQSAASEE